jgi:c-di-GMP-binding flagellar brake protein YcgR
MTEHHALRTHAHVELPGKKYIEVGMLDISLQGMAIVASANPAPGTSFNIRFTIPGPTKGGVLCEERVSVVLSVFSSSLGGFRVSLKFTNLAPASAAAITHYVKVNSS